MPTTVFWNTFGPNATGDIQNRNQIFELTAAEGGLFSEVQFGGNHPGSVELIVNKKVYAGAFCCEYGAEHKDELYIISKTMVPNGPFWVNKDFMPQEHIDAIVNYFVNLTPDNAATDIFTGTGTSSDDDTLAPTDRFIAVDTSFYKFLEEMYAGEK